MKAELIKKVDEKQIKAIIDKHKIRDDDFSMLSSNVKAFIEWYNKNKSENTAGGRVSSYDLGECIQIFADEVNYVR